jgi:nucleotide-binding universal stress UspA family protein
MAHPFNRLLLATEHTEYDAGAERLALAMAGRCSLPLAAVLPLVSNPEYEAVAPQLAAQAEAAAAARLQALQQAAQRSGVSLATRVRRGPELDQEIVDEARRVNADLVIARQRGKRGFLARLLVGEMVSRVVAHAPCSVLLVPQQGAMWQRGVLLALDPQQGLPQQLPLLVTACQVAAECGLPLHLVCASEGDGAAETAARAVLAQALEQARRAGGPALLCHAMFRRGRAHEQIVGAARASAADLVVMGRHGSPLGGRAFLGGTTQKVIGTAELPVLVVIPSSNDSSTPP